MLTPSTRIPASLQWFDRVSRMESKMPKYATSLLALAFALSSVSMPTGASAAPATNAGDNLAACRQLNQEDPNVSVGGCLGFVQTFYTSHEHGWIPHYCRALLYYEPESFYEQYDSVPDCIQANEGNPPF
jgi:hypothetical protein